MFKFLSKINILGLLLLLANTWFSFGIGTAEYHIALDHNNGGWGFMMLFILDFPSSFLAIASIPVIQLLIAMMFGVGGNQYSIISGAVGFAIFGGIQWYWIGCFITKIFFRIITWFRQKAQSIASGTGNK